MPTETDRCSRWHSNRYKPETTGYFDRMTEHFQATVVGTEPGKARLAKQETTVQDSISTFVSVKPLDISMLRPDQNRTM